MSFHDPNQNFESHQSAHACCDNQTTCYYSHTRILISVTVLAVSHLKLRDSTHKSRTVLYSCSLGKSSKEIIQYVSRTMILSYFYWLKPFVSNIRVTHIFLPNRIIQLQINAWLAYDITIPTIDNIPTDIIMCTHELLYNIKTLSKISSSYSNIINQLE